MPMNLSTTISKIKCVPNATNVALLNEFCDYMKRNGAGEHHIKNELYAKIQFAMFLGKDVTFHDVSKKTQIPDYLDTRRKPKDVDPDERWKTTWNDYFDDIRHFFRWLHNQRGKDDLTDPREWETPAFTKIKKQKTKRLSPYSELEIWDRDDILLIVKYATHINNKAALGLFWDLDARNHEVTTIRIKNVRLKEMYAEGEVPFEAKTGSGPVLLTLSFPYVRDWLNEHPFAGNPDSRIIVSLKNGAPVKPAAMWSMKQQLRKRIARLIKRGAIADPAERERLEHILKTKRWNPYCIRHSAITYDSDSLPEFALRKKVRWSMNSKQPGRYIKRRLGDGLKRQRYWQEKGS
ncbi:MAG: hypothetical protein AB1351_03235 [Thermoproteota archaeon]